MNIRNGFSGLACLCALMVPLGAAAQAQPSVSRQIFSEVDLNRDGYVDLDEFHKDIVASFHVLDNNRDGYISIEEIRAIPDKGRVEALLKFMGLSDANKDKKLSFKEVVEARMAIFDQADSNKDGRLSLEEVVAYNAKGAQRFAAASTSPAKASSGAPR